MILSLNLIGGWEQNPQKSNMAAPTAVLTRTHWKQDVQFSALSKTYRFTCYISVGTCDAAETVFSRL